MRVKWFSGGLVHLRAQFANVYLFIEMLTSIYKVYFDYFVGLRDKRAQ